MAQPYYAFILPDGSEYPLLKEQGVTVEQAHGVGMPPVRNITTDYALLDGGSWQRNRAQQGGISFLLTIHGPGARRRFRAFRRVLIETVNPHRVCLPIELRYYGYTGIRRCYVHYDAGLEMGNESGGSEQIMLRLLLPDPFWYGADESGAVDPGAFLTMAYTVGVTEGAWDNLDAGANGNVLILAAAPGGGVYAGGMFTSIGGVAANYIAYWDGTAWSPLGPGMDDWVYALAVAPNGDLYAGGYFTTAGGGAALRVARWDGAAWTALGAGMDAPVRALTFGLDGTLYAGGLFTTAGGGAALRVAAWNGAAWSALAGGLDSFAYALVIDPADGALFVGGAFTTAGGGAAVRVARWDGAAWTALGAGCNNTVSALEIGSDGALYAGGQLTTAGGISANRVARWNGLAWSPLGSGLGGASDAASVIRRLSNGWLLVGGRISDAGGILTGSTAMWNGYSWVPVPIILAGALPDTYAFAEDALTGGWYLGGAFVSPPNMMVSALTTLTPSGNARSYPVIEITRDALGPTDENRVYYLRNETTGKTLWFDYLLQPGETFTIDTRPGQKRCYSSFFGVHIGNNPLPGSQLASWDLAPGANIISTLIYGWSPHTTIWARWLPAHWGVD